MANQYPADEVGFDYLKTQGIPETEISAILSKTRSAAGLEAAARDWLESNSAFLLTSRHPELAPALAERLDDSIPLDELLFTAGRSPKPPAAPDTAECESATDAKKPDDALPKIGKQARALALLMEHPEWTDAKIARNVPCVRQSLYRFPKYTAARELLERERVTRPRGSKSTDGDVEAWNDE